MNSTRINNLNGANSAIGFGAKIARCAVIMIYIAIVCFLVFGSLKSTTKFANHTVVFHLFYHLPLSLIGISALMSLHSAFVLYRYRLCAHASIMLVLLVCVLLCAFELIFLGSCYFGALAWVGAAFLFRHQFNRYLEYIHAHHR